MTPREVEFAFYLPNPPTIDSIDDSLRWVRARLDGAGGSWDVSQMQLHPFARQATRVVFTVAVVPREPGCPPA